MPVQERVNEYKNSRPHTRARGYPVITELEVWRHVAIDRRCVPDSGSRAAGEPAGARPERQLQFGACAQAGIQLVGRISAAQSADDSPAEGYAPDQIRG